MKLITPEIKKENIVKREINQRSFAMLKTWEFIL